MKMKKIKRSRNNNVKKIKNSKNRKIRKIKNIKNKNIKNKKNILGGKKRTTLNNKKIKFGGANLDNYHIDIHKNYKCAPNVYAFKENIYNDKLNRADGFDTCYSKDQLNSLAFAYNKINGGNRGIGGTEKNGKVLEIENKNKETLWNELKEKLEDECGDNEYCWINSKNPKNPKNKIINYLPEKVKESILNKTFKPERPLGKNGKNLSAWLSNIDIEKVATQLKEIYNDFELLGPYPIDFYNYRDNIPEYNLNVKLINNLINKGKRRIAIVFNTGTLKSGGIHWIALFLDFKNKNPITGEYTIEFFDSVGNKPPKVVALLIEQIKDDICPKFVNGCIKMHEKIKQFPHQKGNNECGVYCLYFITEKLKGRSYESIQANEMTDAMMNEFRNKFFMLS
jgi:hypothetical protein